MLKCQTCAYWSQMNDKCLNTNKPCRYVEISRYDDVMNEYNRALIAAEQLKNVMLKSFEEDCEDEEV